jgi:Putative zinc-finger
VTACERMRSSLGAYVLGALDAEDEAEVRRHLETCPICAAERELLAPLPGLLESASGAEAAHANPLPPAFEERLLDAFARDRAVAAPRRRRRLRLPRLPRGPQLRWMAAGAGAVAVIAAAVVAVLALTGGDDGRPLYQVRFKTTAAAPPTAKAYARLDSVSGGTELHLWIRGMEADPGAIYEVVCEAPTWSASAGTFRVDTRGKAYVILNTAARRGEYDGIRVVRRIRTRGGEFVERDMLTAQLRSS